MRKFPLSRRCCFLARPFAFSTRKTKRSRHQLCPVGKKKPSAFPKTELLNHCTFLREKKSVAAHRAPVRLRTTLALRAPAHVPQAAFNSVRSAALDLAATVSVARATQSDVEACCGGVWELYKAHVVGTLERFQPGARRAQRGKRLFFARASLAKQCTAIPMAGRLN